MFRNMTDPCNFDDDVSEQIARELEADDDPGEAAESMLAAGFPIFYAEDDTPAGWLIKEYPGGRRVLVESATSQEVPYHPRCA